MFDITITVGHNVGAVEKLTTPAICETFERLAGVEAYTAIPCRGMWRGMAEASTRLEVSAIGPDVLERIREALPVMARELEQEAIAVTVRESAFELVYA